MTTAKKFARVLKFAFICLALTGITSCGSSFLANVDNSAPWCNLYVTYVNNSGEATHMYGRNEKGGPGNRVEPGMSRTGYYVQRSKFHNMTFFAFRNGNVISTKDIVFDQSIFVWDPEGDKGEGEWVGYYTISFPW